MTEGQVRDLVAHIECPMRVIFADPAQPYLPERCAASAPRCCRDGEAMVIAGGHHLHMEEPAAVAAAIGGFFAGPAPIDCCFAAAAG